ncbi:prion protein b [Pygocentrus nattereri]|uniref:prion protein b n=1 Tax=Pygocentrus nattereri TaxID=42514 RepID=UPI000814A116|nr:prion protein b [Pygocentrus nattereri]
MGQLCHYTVLCLALMAVLHSTSAGRKGGSVGRRTSSTKTTSSSSSSKGTSSSSGKSTSSSVKPAQGSKTKDHRYPAGGYPVRSEGQPGGYPSIGGAYPNWNPNNKILSPRYGGGFGGGYGGNGHGSPFSHTVQSMGYTPSLKSKGFGKKAALAAGAGAIAGMAVGYGLGHVPRPHFSFSSPKEEHYYNHYMYQRYGTKSTTKSTTRSTTRSTNKNDYGQDNVFKPPQEAQSYEKYMDTCMNRTDLLRDQDTKVSHVQRDDLISGSSALASGTLERSGPAERGINYIQRNESAPQSPALANGTLETTGPEESGTKSDIPVPAELQQIDDDMVSIMEIGYPSLIQQMKAQKCVELYIVYSESNKGQNGCSSSGPHLLLTTIIMALSSAFLLQ